MDHDYGPFFVRGKQKGPTHVHVVCKLPYSNGISALPSTLKTIVCLSEGICLDRVLRMARELRVQYEGATCNKNIRPVGMPPNYRVAFTIQPPPRSSSPT
jgi:hypothetical protein